VVTTWSPNPGQIISVLCVCTNFLKCWYRYWGRHVFVRPHYSYPKLLIGFWWNLVFRNKITSCRTSLVLSDRSEYRFYCPWNSNRTLCPVLLQNGSSSCMEHSPSWDTHSAHSAGQQIPRLLWNPKTHHRVHKSPQLDLNVSHLNPVHTLIHFLFNIGFNIILQFTPTFSKRSLPFRFTDQSCARVSSLSHACCMPRPSHPPIFGNPNDIRWSVQIMKLLRNVIFPNLLYFTSSFLGLNVLLCTPFSNTLSLRSLSYAC
jgi:hypothetical protein